MDEKQAIGLLKKYAKDDEAYDQVLAHVLAVKDLAVEIADKILQKHPEIKIDLDFIICASILHDIGRFDCPPGKDSPRHGVIGADIIRKEGLDQRFALVCERHLGGGITKQDVLDQDLDIPKKDYLPETIEEKIITYADKLISRDRRISAEEAIRRFHKEIGDRAGTRVQALHNEIEALMR